MKSILKNTPKMEEREETGDMMELDPLEPEDDGPLKIFLLYHFIEISPQPRRLYDLFSSD